MARPYKSGLTFYPREVNAESKDPALKFIFLKYRQVGKATFFDILDNVYGDKGYYAVWGDSEEELFCAEYGIDRTMFDNMLKDCFEKKLFEHSLYTKYKIITSDAIQKTYINCVARRKSVQLYKQFLLINLKSIEFEHITNIELVNYDNKKIIKPVKQILKTRVVGGLFERFWAVYRKKDKKDEAILAFNENVKDDEIEEVIKAVKNYNTMQKDNETRFLTPASKFLSNWRDYLENEKANKRRIKKLK